MSIVRSLLIKIGFQTDKKALTNVNRSIEGFKTRFAIAAASVGFALKKAFDLFDNLAASTIQAQNFAKYLGVSLKEMIQLQKAFKGFGIDENQFDQIFSRLNKLLVDFRTGANNELRKLAQDLNFEIQADAGPIQLLFDVLTAISKLNESDRARVSGNIFSPEVATQIAEVSTNLDKIVSSARSYEDAAKNIEDSTKVLREYKRAMDDIQNSIYDLSITLSSIALPYITPLLNIFKGLIDMYDGLFNLNFNKVVSSVKSISKSLDDVFDLTGMGLIKKIAQNSDVRGMKDRFVEYAENRVVDPKRFVTPNGAVFSPIVNNSIEINVSGEATTEQGLSIQQQVAEGVRQGVESTFSGIQNNFPKVE